jgi:hypothetical protein
LKYFKLTPRKGVSSLPQSMNKTPYVSTTVFIVSAISRKPGPESDIHIPEPHCANLTPLVHLGLAHFNFARLLYRRSSLNWCLGESFEKSGGHIRLALYGFASKSKSGFGASTLRRINVENIV